MVFVPAAGSPLEPGHKPGDASGETVMLAWSSSWATDGRIRVSDHAVVVGTRTRDHWFAGMDERSAPMRVGRIVHRTSSPGVGPSGRVATGRISHWKLMTWPTRRLPEGVSVPRLGGRARRGGETVDQETADAALPDSGRRSIGREDPR